MALSNDQLYTVSLDTDYDIDEVSTAKIKHGGPLPIVHTHIPFRDGPATPTAIVWGVCDWRR
jgi:hypothetical protein